MKTINLTFSEEDMLAYFVRKNNKAFLHKFPVQPEHIHGSTFKEMPDKKGLAVMYEKRIETMSDVFEKCFKLDLLGLGHTIPLKTFLYKPEEKPKDVCSCGVKHPLVAEFGACGRCMDELM